MELDNPETASNQLTSDRTRRLIRANGVTPSKRMRKDWAGDPGAIYAEYRM